MANVLLLVDAYSLIYRAFFAIKFLTGPNGEPVNAIYGLTKMLRKLLAEYQPTHCGVVFDLGAPAARLAILPSYKEHRPPTPPDLDAQLPAIREVLEALRFVIVEVEGQEADDLIATLAVQSVRAKYRVLIASNDKDFAQLVDTNIRLIRPNGKEDALFDAAAVKDRYGVRPDQMVDLLSLVGDSVDNIRGVAGVGEKTAVQLLHQYDSIDNLLKHAGKISKPRLREALLAARGDLLRNRQLIALHTDVALPVALADLKLQPLDYTRLIACLKRFGFKSFVAELEAEANQTGDLFARS
jgi:DNA polymerase I